MASGFRFVVVGEGPAALMASVHLVRAGHHVDLLSADREVSTDVSLNATLDGDSASLHAQETLRAGDLLGSGPLVLAMAEAAPALVHLLDRMGVPFHRTAEGRLQRRQLAGSSVARSVFAGSATGFQVQRALAQQLLGAEPGTFRQLEGWEYLGLIRDENGAASGVVAVHVWTQAIEVFDADAVLLATTGPSQIYGKSTQGLHATGAALASALVEGATYANPEMMQFHPLGVPGPDGHRFISEAALADGAQLMIDGQRVMPERLDDLARKVSSHDAVLHLGSIARPTLDARWELLLRTHEKLTGQDLRRHPCKVVPVPHVSLGGLQVGVASDKNGKLVEESARNQQTTVAGLYAAGDAGAGYHGANMLGGNRLLASLFSGQLAARAMMFHAQARPQRAPATDVVDATRRWRDRMRALADMKGAESPRKLHDELGALMTRACGLNRDDAQLDEALTVVRALKERGKALGVSDPTTTLLAHRLQHMLTLAEITVMGARARAESRGVHHKPTLPNRNDTAWEKVTLVRLGAEGPEVTHEAVETGMNPPPERIP
ncbi:MAG: FAD-binding protein [Myxococcota bacterium]